MRRIRSTISLAVFAGAALISSGGAVGVSTSPAAALAATTITTHASPSVSVGNAIFDRANITGYIPGVLTNGHVVFTLYGPDDPTCSGTPVVTETIEVDPGTEGKGTARSEDFTPTVAGTYRWMAKFNGTSYSDPAGPTDCNDPAEKTVVTAGPPPSSTTTSTSTTTVPTSPADLKCSVKNRGAKPPVVVCKTTDADGVLEVTVTDGASGGQLRLGLDCHPSNKALSFRYTVPTTTQVVQVTDCDGHTKTFRVEPDGTVT